MGAEEFIRRLKSTVEKPNCRFAIFLGAGCSISSDIPSASSLVRIWLRRLKRIKTGSETGVLEWVEGEFAGYEDHKAAEYYGSVIEKLFLTSSERQKEIEQWIEGKDPGFGYAVLAQLLSHPTYASHFNPIITTNFDDMVSDALYLYTNKKPLVIAHESLIGFVKMIQTRPIIIKLHGDARLAPKNTEIETKTLDDGVKIALKKLLSETGLIFIGYGGNDTSIVEILTNLSDKSLPWGVWWINQKLPKSEMKKWLKERDATWVQHKDFDELMLLIWHEFDLLHPKKDRFDKLIKNYYDTFSTLREQVEIKPDSVEKRKMEEVLEIAVEKIKDWWEVELEAKKYIIKEPEIANQIYNEGLTKFPKSLFLLNQYAIFLTDIRKEHDKAETYFKNALDLSPNDAFSLGNYGVFLYKIRKNYQKAEEYYKKALEVNPTYTTVLGNYALLSAEIHKNYDAAEEFFRTALELEPNNVTNLRKYAWFLRLFRKDYDAAGEYYRKALELDPINVETLEKYVEILTKIHLEYDTAEEYYKKALNQEPNNAIILGNYAKFLTKIRKNDDAAEEYYKKALNQEPNNVIILRNYAEFLTKIRKNDDAAEEHHKKALNQEPNNVVTLGKYAEFLTEIRKDYDAAEEYYETALALEPNHVLLLGKYAGFLKSIRKDYDRSEELFKKALVFDTNHSDILMLYAIFLKDIRKDYKEADKYFIKAIEIEPNNANYLGNYAGFLLALGKKEAGFNFLNKAFQLELSPPALIPEILFYRFAHAQDEDLRKDSLIELKSILKTGIRSPGWNLKDNVKQALSDGHPYPEFLKVLAKVISNEVHLDQLEKFHIWISS